MKKSMSAIGGSLGIIIDKPIADLYGITKNTQVEITPKEDGLSIRFLHEASTRSATDEEVLRIAKKTNKRYSNMMKNLAK